jgi:hypothetical protein
MRRIHSWMTALAFIPVTAAGAQSGQSSLRAGLSVATIAFRGATEPVEDRSDNLTALPFRPTMWGITLAYGAAGMRVRLTAAYGQPGLMLRGNPAATPDEAGEALLIIADNVFKLSAGSATISIPVKQFSAGPSLRPSLGLLLERWSSPGAQAQTIVGGQAGLLLEVPLTRSLSGSVTGDVGYTPSSPFKEEGVPQGFKTRSTWRRTLSGGVMLKL